MSRIGISTKTEGRFMIAWGWEECNENILKLIMVMVVQLWVYQKSVNCTSFICELYGMWIKATMEVFKDNTCHMFWAVPVTPALPAQSQRSWQLWRSRVPGASPSWIPFVWSSLFWTVPSFSPFSHSTDMCASLSWQDTDGVERRRAGLVG